MFLAKIINFIAKFKQYIWTPFRNWFWGSALVTTTWQYKGALDMQEYLPAETIEIRITKFQSFLLWLLDWKIFNWIKDFWSFLTNFFGISKYIIFFLIALFIMMIIYRIMNYFYTRLLPRRIQTNKEGLEFFESLVQKDAGHFFGLNTNIVTKQFTSEETEYHNTFVQFCDLENKLTLLLDKHKTKLPKDLLNNINIGLNLDLKQIWKNSNKESIYAQQNVPATFSLKDKTQIYKIKSDIYFKLINEVYSWEQNKTQKNP